MKTWRDIKPEDATTISLPHDGIEGPMNELGERCPWPWDPQQLVGAPLGQYHCPYCGGMQVAGTPHLDWTAEQIAEMNDSDHPPVAAGQPSSPQSSPTGAVITYPDDEVEP